MIRIAKQILLASLLTLIGSSAFAATWYIRPDGGTRYSANRVAQGKSAQCDGLHNAPYPGTGTNQPCAYNDYRFLWDDQATYATLAWVIAGGDTVILYPHLVNGVDTGWRVGFDQGASANDVWCSGGSGTFYCENPVIPAGTPAQHTRILGVNWQNCSSGRSPNKSAMTQVFGGYGVTMALNLSGAKYLDVQCLNIARHSQCALGGLLNSGLEYPAACSKSGTIDDYDSNGIEEDNQTSNLFLEDLWIHGHPGRGIKGPIGGPIVANRVDIAYNEGGGWDFDDGNGTPSTDTFGANASWAFTNSIIEWSGCYEEYPIVDPFPALSCYDQNHQGYGDGVGTVGGQWPTSILIDHSIFAYNVQDGEDFGHVDGGLGSFTITNSVSYANGGGQFKWGWGFGKILFQNNLVLSNCYRMALPIPGAAAVMAFVPSDLCRAGDALSFNFNDQSVALFDHNTIVTYAPTTFDYKCLIINSQTNCNDTVFTLSNNIIRAYASPYSTYNGDGGPGGYCGSYCNGNYTEALGDGNNNGFIGTINRDHNVYYGLQGSCIANTQAPDVVNGVSTNETCVDPLFVNEPVVGGVNVDEADTYLDNFNFALASNSPARGSGSSASGLLADFLSNPYSNPPSIGALEYGSKAAALPHYEVPIPLNLPATTGVGAGGNLNGQINIQ